MSDIPIKICGLTSPEAVDAAVDAGATHVGFVQYEPSPRHVTLEDASKLRRRVPEGVKIVMVTVKAQPEQLARAWDVIKPDVIQFHGSETAQWMELIKKTLKVETWRSIGLSDEGTLERMKPFQAVVDKMLFDAPSKKLPGGNGIAFDWSLLEGRDDLGDWVLAGGLDADNVADAIRKTGAPMVDASSGVEDSPGVKNPDKIRAFIDAVRAA